MNVISYYQPIENLKFSNESYELLKKWESNWRKMDWNPIVLNEDYAKKNIYYKKIDFNDYNSLLYSKNNSPNYLKQCYMRWLAYTQFAFENGATVWCDYDVYNKTFTLEKFRSLNDNQQLFCGSGAVGLMNAEAANEIMKTLEIIKSSTSLENLKDVPEPYKKYFIKQKDTFCDMHIIQAIFLINSPNKFKRLCYGFIKQTSQTTIKEFDLFHIHGGVFDEKNKNRLFSDHLVLKKMSRSQQWDYVENFLNNSSLNETFADLIFKLNA